MRLVDTAENELNDNLSPLKVHGILEPGQVLRNFPFDNVCLTRRSTLLDLKRILLKQTPEIQESDVVLVQNGVRRHDHEEAAFSKLQRTPLFAFVSAVSCRSTLQFLLKRVSAPSSPREFLVSANTRADVLMADLQASKVILTGSLLKGSSLIGDYYLKLASNSGKKPRQLLAFPASPSVCATGNPAVAVISSAEAPAHVPAALLSQLRLRKMPENKRSCTARFKGLGGRQGSASAARSAAASASAAISRELMRSITEMGLGVAMAASSSPLSANADKRRSSLSPSPSPQK